MCMPVYACACLPSACARLGGRGDLGVTRARCALEPGPRRQWLEKLRLDRPRPSPAGPSRLELAFYFFCGGGEGVSGGN